MPMEANLADLFEAAVDAYPEREYLIANGARRTYAEMEARANRLAHHLAAQGIGPGSRVAWQLPTRTATVITMAAMARLGAVQAPVIPIYRERETGAAVATAGAEFILVPGTWRGFDYAAMAAGLPTACVIASAMSGVAQTVQREFSSPSLKTRRTLRRWWIVASFSVMLKKMAS